MRTATSSSMAATVLRLVRVENCFAVALTTLLGAHLAGGGQAVRTSTALLAVLATALLHGAGNVINDRMDVAVDADARPERPLPSGRISIATADHIYVGLTVAGVMCAATLGAASVLVAAAVVASSFGYSYRIKATVLGGNLLVASLAAATVLYGSWVTGGVGVRTWIAAASVLVLMLSFEILKCVQDHETDAAHGIRTVSTVIGRRPAVRVGTALLLPFAALALAPGILIDVSPAYLPLAVGVVTLTGAGAAHLMSADPGRAAVDRCVARLKQSWFLGIIALAALRP
jgi:geranylgeranylglycerol-phosphate geranylgeranyltransferase